MTNPPPPGNWTDPTWSAQPSSPAPDPTVVAGQPVPPQPGPVDPYAPDPYAPNPYAPVDPYAGAQPPATQPMPGYAPPGYAPQGYPPQYPGYGYPQPPKTNGMAIAAFVLALIGVTSCITAPVGAILGHVAQKQIRQSGEGGAGMAKAAIIVGWILTGFLVLVILFYVGAIIYAIATSNDSSSGY
ncbi:DUF4190 domain-containing protein [Micromonospora vinacea]|uniref:DUF4190 domain-containing protein n=1 Tax=Micromonospora vinacea TaxID=709878 RepID=A0ABS0K0H5_9ACTN|nr:DUF4190 domain-containing protein [Micromonospora vinacea]MBG6102125.1 hypothetical protein [Micromonospora vinacea]WSZ75072.1 DUF4190 domain-containing protein [Micromonospora sp. NBC_00860]WTA68438.1 DUF4190 domain-containing protein [Micromonospora sp. NBC_00855]